MKYVEKMGLIKFDFLGLKTLTVIDKACKYLKDIGKTIDVNELPLDNLKTFELLKRGDTTGVFQLEGQGMKETLKKFFPIDLKILLLLFHFIDQDQWIIFQLI